MIPPLPCPSPPSRWDLPTLDRSIYHQHLRMSQYVLYLYRAIWGRKAYRETIPPHPKSHNFLINHGIAKIIWLKQIFLVARWFNNSKAQAVCLLKFYGWGYSLLCLSYGSLCSPINILSAGPPKPMVFSWCARIPSSSLHQEYSYNSSPACQHYTQLYILPALHCTALHCTALHCTQLYFTALHSTALFCTALN